MRMYIAIFGFVERIFVYLVLCRDLEGGVVFIYQEVDYRGGSPTGCKKEWWEFLISLISYVKNDHIQIQFDSNNYIYEFEIYN